MTIDETIALLNDLKETYGGEMPVYLSKDAEGNRYRPLDCWGELADNGSGMDAFERDDEDDEDDIEGVEAIALFPC